ncbi:hypothetical protein [Amycolatopsis rubida]|uniref:hypothetical protein n=1 Tax=Amycolatopsis rubida TaxID=112413 RepID=UPI00136FF67D|nr:hypothetical protein [Amycolatopsis rubida]MYW90743.1 hypothetical protein [Amycolatopsis rubida]
MPDSVQPAAFHPVPQSVADFVGGPGRTTPLESFDDGGDVEFLSRFDDQPDHPPQRHILSHLPGVTRLRLSRLAGACFAEGTSRRGACRRAASDLVGARGGSIVGVTQRDDALASFQQPSRDRRDRASFASLLDRPCDPVDVGGNGVRGILAGLGHAHTSISPDQDSLVRDSTYRDLRR